jgi:hypothetical protein
MYLDLMSTEWTVWLREIDAIATAWTLLICDESLEDILWRIEPLLYTEYEESEYSDDEDRPEELYEVEEGSERCEEREEELPDLVRDDIPEE